MEGEGMLRFETVGFIGTLAVALALPGVAIARPDRGHPDPHRDPGAFIEENAEALGLEAETLGAIRRIVEESKGTGEQLHAKLRELHERMKELLSQAAPDESAVMKQVEAIGAAEIEMQKHRLGTMLEIRALLTPGQREEMTRLREASRSRWKHALMEACESDLEALCPEADDRSSRRQCLKEHRDGVSPACSDAIEAARHARHAAHEGWSGHHGPDCAEHHGPDCAEHHGQGCAEHDGPGCADADGPGAAGKGESRDAY